MYYIQLWTHPVPSHPLAQPPQFDRVGNLLLCNEKPSSSMSGTLFGGVRNPVWKGQEQTLVGSANHLGGVRDQCQQGQEHTFVGSGQHFRGGRNPFWCAQKPTLAGPGTHFGMISNPIWQGQEPASVRFRIHFNRVRNPFQHSQEPTLRWSLNQFIEVRNPLFCIGTHFVWVRTPYWWVQELTTVGSGTIIDRFRIPLRWDQEPTQAS